MAEKEYMTRKEAASYLRLSEKTLAAWHLSGRLRGLKIGRARTSRVLYEKSALDRWLAQYAPHGTDLEAADAER